MPDVSKEYNNLKASIELLDRLLEDDDAVDEYVEQTFEVLYNVRAFIMKTEGIIV